MKNSFREYYGLSSSELEKLWKDGLIVFDTNVLLSLYRRSEEARNDFISMIKSLKDRVWLPHQVGYEYHEHRLEEALRPIEAIKSIKGKLQKFETELEQDFGNNPYLDYKKIKSAFKTLGSKIDKLILASQTSFPDYLNEDSVLTVLTEVFDGKIGPEYQEKKLLEIYKLGNERYSNKLPPGYKDTKKHEGERHRFGDLIIWLQIIEHAKTVAKDIIFVTDDKKEDWWEEYKDNRLGPRHELIREFRAGTNNQLIWFYTPDRFLQYAKSKVGVSIKTKTIEEVKGPVIDLTTVLGQGTIPGQVSFNARWPYVSLGESNPLDIGASSLLASRTGSAGVLNLLSLGEVDNADRMKNSGLLGEGGTLAGKEINPLNGNWGDGSPKINLTSTSTSKKENDSDNNQDKEEK